MPDTFDAADQQPKPATVTTFDPSETQKPSNAVEATVTAPPGINDPITQVPEGQPQPAPVVQPTPADQPAALPVGNVAAAQKNLDDAKAAVDQAAALDSIANPKLGDSVLVTQDGVEVDGQTEFAGIVTKIFDMPGGKHVRVTAFPPNGYVLNIDTALHVDDPSPGKSRWRWAPLDD